MAKFQKKPVVIEAHRLLPGFAGIIAEWIGSYGRFIEDDFAFVIETREGTMRANRGDWIIRGVMGEFYPCKHDIFVATYEYAE